MSNDFRTLPDLAVRTLGGSVVYANDEAFADRENLIRADAAAFDESSFGHKGKVYDGWETRRRRELGHDVAIVRLGAPGVVRGVVIDTAWFKGNYPPEASVEAACVSGYPSVAELVDDTTWETILARSEIKGDTENAFPVDSERRWTHVRLSIYPDGGVARFRVHGEVLPDPRVLDAMGSLDLAALDNGALVVDCSNTFYSSPNNLISPGLTRTMGEGWETARRRDDGNDWVTVQLAGAGTLVMAELDTSYFLGNSPPCPPAPPPRPWSRTACPQPMLKSWLPDARSRAVTTCQPAYGDGSAERRSAVTGAICADGGAGMVQALGAWLRRGNKAAIVANTASSSVTR